MHGNFLVVQWLGLVLALQRVQVQSLVRTKIPQAAQHSQKKIYVQKRKRLTDTENKLMVTKGEGEA